MAMYLLAVMNAVIEWFDQGLMIVSWWCVVCTGVLSS